MLKRARKPRGAFRSCTSKDCYFLDPWRDAVCDRCPLPDCVRPEGAIFAGCQPGGSYGKAIQPCPIYQAEERGWGPDEAAERGAELGLLEKGEWGEW